MSYITTYGKIHFTPAEPKSEDINIRDIAHALSLMCRANGHFERFFSVAQHSINCAIEAKARGHSKRVQLACLLHDASEAYISDVTRPVKQLLAEYITIEKRLQAVIYEKYLDEPLTEEEHTLIKQIDDAMLYCEFMELMGEAVSLQKPNIYSKINLETRDFKSVENEFIRLFQSLTDTDENSLFPEDNFISVGIDGCRGGWVAVCLSNRGFSVRVFNKIKDICNEYKDTQSMIIDIPIGLVDNAEQVRPDAELRKSIKGKTSSVFNTPCRQAVYAKNYTAAIAENKKVLDMSISPLSNAIIPKIREVDSFLQNNPKWKNRLVESHPEFAFTVLNGDKPILANKQTAAGASERLDVLSRYYPDCHNVVQEFKKIAKTSKVDDAIDALALAVMGAIGISKGFMSIPNVPQEDSAGLLMQIVGVELNDGAKKDSINTADVQAEIDKLNAEMMELVENGVKSGLDMDELDGEFQKISDCIKELQGTLRLHERQVQTASLSSSKVNDILAALQTMDFGITEYNDTAVRQLIRSIKVLSVDRVKIYWEHGEVTMVELK